MSICRKGEYDDVSWKYQGNVREIGKSVVSSEWPLCLLQYYRIFASVLEISQHYLTF